MQENFLRFIIFKTGGGTILKKQRENDIHLKDGLGSDVLKKLQEKKKSLQKAEEKRQEEERERRLEEKRQREKNKSFDELLNESDLKWKDFK